MSNVYENPDIFTIGSFQHYFTIRWYKEPAWGYMHMGGPRHCFNCGHIAFLFERYS